MTTFTTKQQAIAAVEARGYVRAGESESGDHGYGSRIYFEKPGCDRYESGAPKDHAQVSRVGREWYASINYAPLE